MIAGLFVNISTLSNFLLSLSSRVYKSLKRETIGKAVLGMNWPEKRGKLQN
jgi:hypothetical protein